MRGALTPLTRPERNVVTCPSLLRHQPAAAFLDDVAHARHFRAGVRRFAARLQRDDGQAQFGRFVLVGGASTLLYGVLYLALGDLGYLPAHVAATVASTVLANELHRQLTFRAEDRVDWLSAQLEAGGVALVGLLASGVALGWLNSSADSPVALQVLLVATVTGLIGLVRFVALRWIFRPTGAAAAR
jgi:putative flippase GtrA